MFDRDQYELLDFGRGRKLERFGQWMIDRPSPTAEHADRTNSNWRNVAASYDRMRGIWKPNGGVPESWRIQHESLTFELRPTPVGHLGVFPEQAENWDWIAKQVAQSRQPLKILNLFAYTGGSTLSAAAGRAEVVHIDSAKNTVAWARRNAELSGLAEAKIRWIVEDAVKFVDRELRRGNQYNAVILDPPSYGHGPKRESWQIARDLPQLLETCAQLTKTDRAFILLTCHSPEFGPAEVEAILADTFFGSCQAGAVARPLTIRCSDGRDLPSGVVAHWPG
jgi:23S rRNA (cytosine1962-C5)-methyltransferase